MERMDDGRRVRAHIGMTGGAQMSRMGGPHAEGEGTSRIFLVCNGVFVDWILLNSDGQHEEEVVCILSDKYYAGYNRSPSMYIDIMSVLTANGSPATICATYLSAML